MFKHARWCRAIAVKHFARRDCKSIGFIGAGRETDEERIYFNAVGLAYAMYQRAKEAGTGHKLNIQEDFR